MNDGQCDWVANGRRCHYPGVIGASTTGGGPRYCLAHDQCSGGAKGAQIVERSLIDVPHPDYSCEARRRMAEEAMDNRLKSWMDKFRARKDAA